MYVNLIMEKAISPFKETLTFLKRWCVHPYQLGAILPSSRALARFIASCALQNLEEEDYVLELGAGTGRLTQALLDQGLDPRRLICLEIDPDLANYLLDRFPQTHIIQGSACALESLVPSSLHKKVGVVISGLPMLSFPHIVQQEILRGCFDILKMHGRLLQFTYSPFSSIDAHRFRMRKQRLGWVIRNVPPACVWSYTQETLWS